MSVGLPRAVLPRLGFDPDMPDGQEARLPVGELDITEDDVKALRLSAAFTLRPPASGRLGFSYRRVPPWLRSLAASIIGRVKRRQVARWAKFPSWPLDLSADALADLMPGPLRAHDTPTAVILSHDLDSEEGLRNFLARFARMEEDVGARSVNFVVPCSWQLDPGQLSEVQARGHELGIHGYDHANRTPFASPDELQRRVEAGWELAQRYGMKGYRAPSLLRTPALYKALAGRYAYDSSIPTSGGLFPVPNNGCASTRPFTVAGLPVLPLSMPRDGSLRFLGHSPKDILDIWIRCAETIRASAGIVVLLTHCEERFSGNPAMLDAYERFLGFITEHGGYRFSSPMEVLAPFSGGDNAGAPS